MRTMLIFILILSASCSRPVVRGIVIDQDRNPVKRATVAFIHGGRTDKTDRSGRWEIKMKIRPNDTVVVSTFTGREVIVGSLFYVSKRGYYGARVKAGSGNIIYETPIRKKVN